MNYEGLRRQGLEPVFSSDDVPRLPGPDAWDGADVVTPRAYWEERVPERTR